MVAIRFVHERRGHGPLVQRAHESGAQLQIELGAAAVLLDHLRHAQLDRLVGRKALAATRAAAAPADALAVVADPRVDHLRVRRFAERGTSCRGASLRSANKKTRRGPVNEQRETDGFPP